MQGSFVDKLLDLMPRLVTSKPSEVVKILQTTLRQSTFLHLPLPEQVGLTENENATSLWTVLASDYFLTYHEAFRIQGLGHTQVLLMSSLFSYVASLGLLLIT